MSNKTKFMKGFNANQLQTKKPPLVAQQQKQFANVSPRQLKKRPETTFLEPKHLHTQSLLSQPPMSCCYNTNSGGLGLNSQEMMIP